MPLPAIKPFVQVAKSTFIWPDIKSIDTTAPESSSFICMPPLYALMAKGVRPKLSAPLRSNAGVATPGTPEKQLRKNAVSAPPNLSVPGLSIQLYTNPLMYARSSRTQFRRIVPPSSVPETWASLISQESVTAAGSIVMNVREALLPNIRRLLTSWPAPNETLPVTRSVSNPLRAATSITSGIVLTGRAAFPLGSVSDPISPH